MSLQDYDGHFLHLSEGCIMQMCRCPTAKRDNEDVTVPAMWHFSTKNTHRFSSEEACAREGRWVLDLGAESRQSRPMNGGEVPICWSLLPWLQNNLFWINQVKNERSCERARKAGNYLLLWTSPIGLWLLSLACQKRKKALKEQGAQQIHNQSPESAVICLPATGNAEKTAKGGNPLPQ